jgi:hypothetical protein
VSSEPGHPGVDVLSDSAAVVVQDRPVVGLSPWLAGVVALCGDTDRLFQVVTADTARVTVPLEEVLRADGARWVVPREDGTGYRDGLRGDPLRWDGFAYVPDPDVRPAVPVPGQVTGGTVRVDVTVRHDATADALLGGVAEDVTVALTGQPPAGWGTAEPVTQPWRRLDLTAFCRERAPRPAHLVLVGASAVGTVEVRRVPSGLLERVRIAAGSADGPDTGAVDRLAADLADRYDVRTMIATLHPGRADATVAPRYLGTPLPYGLLLGPEGVQERGTEHALAAPAPSAEIVGTPRNPSVWFGLTSPHADAGAVLADVLAHFGLA